MALLNKEQIFSARDLKTERVSVKEWGGEVLIKKLSLGEHLEFVEDIEKLSQIDAMFKLLRFACVNEDGSKLFDNDEDLRQLKEKSTEALQRLFVAACKLNGMGKNTLEKEAKNS